MFNLLVNKDKFFKLLLYIYDLTLLENERYSKLYSGIKESENLLDIILLQQANYGDLQAQLYIKKYKNK